MCPEAGESYNTYGFHSPTPEVQSPLSPASSSASLGFIFSFVAFDVFGFLPFVLSGLGALIVVWPFFFVYKVVKC